MKNSYKASGRKVISTKSSHSGSARNGRFMVDEQRPAQLKHPSLGGPSVPTSSPGHREGTQSPVQVRLGDSKALVVAG